MNANNLAMAYLYMVEDEAGHISMAEDRAACGEFRPPYSAGDFKAWIEDELEIQQGQHFAHPEEGRYPYISILERDLKVLDALDVEADKRAFESFESFASATV